MNHSISHITYEEHIARLFPARERDAHKGNFGHVLIIGGDLGYGGAVGLAALGALRTGAGRVSVATRPEHVGALIGIHPEIMAHGVTKPQGLTPLIEKASVIVLGTGLGRSDWSRALWTLAISTQLPMVLDADALYWLSKDHHVGRDWILTPHPGEAATLLKMRVERVQADRLTAAKAIQRDYGGIAVLKGHETLVQGQGMPFVCTAGNPGMASGGMGDILSGVIGSLLAQHIPSWEAALAGVYIHAHAADLAAEQKGERGLLATDLLPYLRTLVNPV